MKSENALHYARSLTGCSCYLHSSQHLGKAPSLTPLSPLGSFAQAQERGASLSEAGLCLKARTVIWTRRRLHSCRAEPEGAMWSQLPASTTWSTTQHHWLSKAGVWKRLERLSIQLASHWIIVPLVNLLVGIQKGKAGSCIKALTTCMWKLLHLFKIQGTDWGIQTFFFFFLIKERKK